MRQQSARPVRVAQAAGIGNAKVTVAFTSWKDGAVASTQHEIPVVAPRTVDFKLEAVSSRLKGELIHPNKNARIKNIEFTPDGRRIVASDYPGSMVMVWDVSTGKRLTTIETGTMNYAIAPDWKTLFAPRMKTRRIERMEQDGKWMMRWSYDSEVRAWNLDAGKLLRTYKHQPPRPLTNMWSFVETPLRERLNACSLRSPSVPVFCACRRLVAADDAGVQDQPVQVRVLQGAKDPFSDSFA